eukprot:scaffold32213_cov58-Phaeocystis_antarctica.AAC.2
MSGRCGQHRARCGPSGSKRGAKVGRKGSSSCRYFWSDPPYSTRLSKWSRMLPVYGTSASKFSSTKGMNGSISSSRSRIVSRCGSTSGSAWLGSGLGLGLGSGLGLGLGLGLELGLGLRLGLGLVRAGHLVLRDGGEDAGGHALELVGAGDDGGCVGSEAEEGGRILPQQLPGVPLALHLIEHHARRTLLRGNELLVASGHHAVQAGPGLTALVPGQLPQVILEGHELALHDIRLALQDGDTGPVRLLLQAGDDAGAGG